MFSHLLGRLWAAATFVAGGVAGYFVGMFFMDVAGMPIVRVYGLQEQHHAVKEWYDAYSAWAVAVAGLASAPYKLRTLTTGAFLVDFVTFLLASVASRGLRFFVIAGLAYLYGCMANGCAAFRSAGSTSCCWSRWCSACRALWRSSFWTDARATFCALVSYPLFRPHCFALTPGAACMLPAR